MKPLSCSMAPLIEARRDGRLGQREIASLERHLGTCASCAALAQRLERIAGHIRRPRVPSTEVSHQRQRLALLRAAAQGRRAASHPAWGSFALAALLLGVVAAFVMRPAAQPIAVEETPNVPAGAEWTPAATVAPAHPETPKPPVPPVTAAPARPETPKPPVRPVTVTRAPAKIPKPPIPPGQESASKEFAEGVALIERGDYAKAADKLEAFRAAHPGDARGEDADYLVILAWQRAGRPAAAAQAARRYLELYPDSARRSGVQRLLDNP